MHSCIAGACVHGYICLHWHYSIVNNRVSAAVDGSRISRVHVPTVQYCEVEANSIQDPANEHTTNTKHCAPNVVHAIQPEREGGATAFVRVASSQTLPAAAALQIRHPVKTPLALSLSPAPARGGLATDAFTVCCKVGGACIFFLLISLDNFHSNSNRMARKPEPRVQLK